MSLFFSCFVFLSSITLIASKNSVRYWTGRHGTNDTASNCNADFLKQLKAARSSVDSLGWLALDLVVATQKDGTKAIVMKSLLSQEDLKCMQSLKKMYPTMNIGLWSGAGECWSPDCTLIQMAKNPGPFINSFINFVNKYPFITELWTDFEAKRVYDPLIIRALNDIHQILTSYVRVFRYAGCVHNHEPAYFNETCKQFHQDAPDVMIQGAGTYWNDSVGGFDYLLYDMVSDVGPENVDHLSVAVCPYGCGVPNQATQNELYDRVDLIQKIGSHDISVFEFDAMFNTTNQTTLTTSMWWVNALTYFRTGMKDVLNVTNFLT